MVAGRAAFLRSDREPPMPAPTDAISRATARSSHRLGPRPLGLHLATAALTWSGAVLPGAVWMSGRSGADPASAAAALAEAADRRFRRLLTGIEAYRRHPYRRSVADPPAVWRGTGVRLLDYGSDAPGDAQPLLIVPSLINKHYILDLRPGSSLVRYLAAKGFRPFVVAWDDFGRAARFTTIDDCVAGKLEAALGVVRMITRRRPILIGYCLGATLAVGLAVRRPADIAGLVSLAGPWDFCAGAEGIGPAARFAGAAVEPVLDAAGSLPVDLVQALFFTLDPFLVIDKFLRFAADDPDSAASTAFVAVEDWLNDGFPLPAPVARTLLIDWYGANTPATGRWLVGGRPVDPSALTAPALVVAPADDRIVPPESARALARQIPGAEVMEVALGHVGLIASRRAEKAVWEPLAAWLKEASAGSRL